MEATANNLYPKLGFFKTRLDRCKVLGVPCLTPESPKVYKEGWGGEIGVWVANLYFYAYTVRSVQTMK